MEVSDPKFVPTAAAGVRFSCLALAAILSAANEADASEQLLEAAGALRVAAEKLEPIALTSVE